MTEQHLSLSPFYKGWDVYQQCLVKAITPLTAEQLELRPAPDLWSISMLARHIVATRVWWFHMWLGVGSSNLEPMAEWDEEGQPSRSASEIVAGLEATWEMIQNALAHWTPDDLEQVFHNPLHADRPSRSRQWIIWHLLEHDLHHGGEISLSLGIHGLGGFDL
ncbi:MAG TPA: DinB family protein [Ktedonobacteraceae bacterium]|nr:DinB family protein [Ktedonobacteraceae bacterium]